MFEGESLDCERSRNSCFGLGVVEGFLEEGGLKLRSVYRKVDLIVVGVEARPSH